MENGVCERACDVNYDLMVLKSEFKKLLKSDVSLLHQVFSKENGKEEFTWQVRKHPAD